MSKKVLVLCAHTDDGEIACGGALHKFCAEGALVYYAAFSRASVPDGFPADIIDTEMWKATNSLGIHRQNVFLYDWQVRKLGYVRQDILEEMICLRDRIRPDLVFLPCKDDLHQDHTTIYHEGMRAFKYSTVLGYEMPMNNLSFQARGFIPLRREDVEAKVKAVALYQSQNHRIFTRAEAVRSLCVTRGMQVGQEYAECFDVIRWVMPW
ncbi:MAG: PIG-L family deacetylase [Chitinivibrionales bacterium]|nr:PIG-L family deacetylase [Chitinivibrionales bacterium]